MNLKKTMTPILACMLICGCIKSGNDTIALPYVTTDENGLIPSDVIPDDIRAKLEEHMPVWRGTTYPDIEGEYVISPEKIIYCSDGSGYDMKYADKYISFHKTSGNKYEYRGKQKDETFLPTLVSITGRGDNFTAFFIAEGKDSDGVSWTRTSECISGTITKDGIKDLYLAFIMLEKNDPKKHYIDINVYRVFNDGDGLAKRYSWTGTKSMMDSLCEDCLHSIYQK